MQNEILVLTEAKKLLSNGWCQYQLAQDKNGNQASYWKPSAKAFSMYGAIMRVGLDLDIDVIPAIKLVCSKIPTHGGLASWEDTPNRTQKEVLELIDSVL
jgi:hypothetical protein